MPDKNSVLVYGADELASAIARLLLLSGHAVAMLAQSPKGILRRQMGFIDAWHKNSARLASVEARRVQQDADLLIGLRGGMYVPVFADMAAQNVGRWPWDVIVDVRPWHVLSPDEPRLDAALTIMMGPGAVAGRDCDLVIETGGPDPGGVVRAGPARFGPSPRLALEWPALAPRSGTFRACRMIGDLVEEGEVLAIVDAMPVPAPMSGLLRGLQLSPCSVRADEAVAEITSDRDGQVSGVHPGDQALARAVDFAIEVECQDVTAHPFPRL